MKICDVRLRAVPGLMLVMSLAPLSLVFMTRWQPRVLLDVRELHIKSSVEICVGYDFILDHGEHSVVPGKFRAIGVHPSSVYLCPRVP